MLSLARRLGIVLLVACSVAWSAYGPADGTISGTSFPRAGTER